MATGVLMAPGVLGLLTVDQVEAVLSEAPPAPSLIEGSSAHYAQTRKRAYRRDWVKLCLKRLPRGGS